MIKKLAVVMILLTVLPSVFLFGCGPRFLPTEPSVDFSETDDSDVESVVEETEVVTEEPVYAVSSQPDTVKFVIVQNTRDKMFTLTNADGKSLTIDTSADEGYVGDLIPKSGEYELDKSGYYMLPYSKSFVLTDMDDEIVHVSAEFLHIASVGVQNAASVTLNDDRTVIIEGKGDEEFTYRVWLPDIGEKQALSSDLAVGKDTGKIKVKYNGAKLVIDHISDEEDVSEKTEVYLSEIEDDEEDIVAVPFVTWTDACPWADKIASGKWEDGAGLSNLKRLKAGLLSAHFTPVEEIEEPDAHTVTIIFYDDKDTELGQMIFWEKGRHVEFDGNKFDYDDLGL